jgi:hypothetical protein
VRVVSRDGDSTTILVPKEALVRKLAPPGGAGQQGERRGPGGGPGGPGRGGPGGGGFAFGLGDRAELERRTTPIALTDLQVGDFVFAVAEAGSQGDTLRAAVLIKMEAPPGRRGRGQSPSMDFGDIFGGGGPQ